MSNAVFLSGEKIDLCVPEEGNFEKWSSWFNNQSITQFLEQGKYPNTVKEQRLFYEKSTAAGRFLVLIKTKQGELLGVISLSEINYEKLSCQVAYVCPEKSADARYAALEALALCTQHAFERFGMERVWAGYSYPGLENWIKKIEILGFKTEGILVNGFRHGLTLNDGIRTSITRACYLNLVERRGRLWPGEEKVRKLLQAIKGKDSLAASIREDILSSHANRDQWIERLELDES